MAVEPEEARRILCQFMDELKNEEKGNNYSVTASIGIVEINEKLNMEQVIEKADEVLYRSKENGRNRVTVGMPE